MNGPLDSLPAVTDNPHWLGCRCVVCDREYGTDFGGFVCGDCGVDGILDAVYDYAAITAAGPVVGQDPGGLWRFAPLLPVRPEADHSAWTVGNTPLHDADRLADHLGLGHLVLKDDTCLPSASLKDRASAVAIARARQLGIDHLACASTGNAAASLAVLAARSGMSCTIFVPAAAPKAKLAQLILHGADVIPVDGTYDQAFELCTEACNQFGWYNRSTAINPFTIEGKKTAALEIAAAMTPDSPDAILVPTGDGVILAGIAKGFRDLETGGLINRRPRLIAIQPDGSSTIVQAVRSGAEEAVPSPGATSIADSLTVEMPRNAIGCLAEIRASEGGGVMVSDEAILAAISRLAGASGVFAEPAGAAALAGLEAALDEGLVNRDERVALMVTGNGLKDVNAAARALPSLEPVEASLEGVEHAVSSSS